MVSALPCKAHHHHQVVKEAKVSDRGTVFQLVAQFCSPSMANSQLEDLWRKLILIEAGEALTSVFGHFESRNLNADKVLSS